MDDVPEGAVLLEITRLEGSGTFDKDVVVDKPKPLPPDSSGSLGFTLKGYPNKVSLALAFAAKAEGKGFDISVKVGPKILAACKNPPANIEAAKNELRRKRDDARRNMEKAKTPKDKHAVTHAVEAFDRALASLQFFSEVNKVKVHFRVYLDGDDQHQTVLVTTQGP
jgi:hypothetical protein